MTAASLCPLGLSWHAELSLTLPNFHEAELSFLKDFPPQHNLGDTRKVPLRPALGSPRPTPTDDGEEPWRTPHSAACTRLGPQPWA